MSDHPLTIHPQAPSNRCGQCHATDMLLDPLDCWECPRCQSTTPPARPDIPAAREAWDALVARVDAAKRTGRGGYRKGAGRKALRGPTSVMRVPDAYRPAVEALFAHLDATADRGRQYGRLSSEPLTMRSLHGHLQRLTFVVEPVDWRARPAARFVMDSDESQSSL